MRRHFGFPNDRTSYVKDGEIEPEPSMWVIAYVVCAVACAGLATAYAIWRAWQ